eukprot:264490-Rhodomonas_salina.2
MAQHGPILPSPRQSLSVGPSRAAARAHLPGIGTERYPLEEPSQIPRLVNTISVTSVPELCFLGLDFKRSRYPGQRPGRTRMP